MSEQRQTLPAQHQDQRPGHESEMQPKPEGPMTAAVLLLTFVV
ncbi:hypothetical protein ACLBUQ_31980, partial [Pseudomonas aeruginosa]